MNIKILKLVSSEEILCSLEETTKDAGYVNIKEPISLITVPQEDGQVGLGLAPWMPTSQKREFSILKNHIICIVDPPQKLSEHYNEQFGTIIAPPSGIIHP